MTGHPVGRVSIRRAGAPVGVASVIADLEMVPRWSAMRWTVVCSLLT